MRAACEIAIDQAGLQLSPSLVKIPMTQESGLRGSLIGDLQSLDADDNRIFYFLRAVPIDALPKWIANFARASHALDAGEVYIVVRDYTPAFKQSCADAGAGILRLTDDNAFETVLAYSEATPVDIEQALAARQSELRRGMELKLELMRGEIEQRYQRVSHLVAEMNTEIADEYVNRVEQEYKTLDAWATEMSAKLDAIRADTTPAALAVIEDAVRTGPLLNGGD